MKKNQILLSLFFSVFFPSLLPAQSSSSDSVKINYKKLYGYTLDGRIKEALELLPKENSERISQKDATFITSFKNRFAFEQDKGEYLSGSDTGIYELLKIYRNYWRSSFLNNARRFDTLLFLNLVGFLQRSYPPSKAINLKSDGALISSSLNKYLKEYIQSKGMHTTGFGRTGSYLDFLVWKKETDTIYNLSLSGEPVAVRVIFMDDFVSLGWQDYATLGKHYPGGWATKEALHCVKKAYDLNSEEFRVSYLSHEGRHFADYGLFPKLSSADLEYRAKLTELTLAGETLYKTIEFFINNSNYQSSNSHSIANFCVIRGLSKNLFENDFEKDIKKWELIPVKKIHKESKKLLRKNTRDLNKEGKDVENFIKKKT